MTAELTTPRGTDYYLLSELLTDSEREIRDRVRNFVDAEVLPIINDYWERAQFPFELVPKIAQLGVVGGAITGYGCHGLSRLAAGMVTLELSRGDGSVNTFLGVQNGLAMGSINMLGSEEQKQRWLPAMARLDKVGAFALTEPGHGSDSVGLETTARRDGDDWVLNGAKRWIGNGNIAHLVIVWARDVADGKVKGFVVEKAEAALEATTGYPEGYSAELITGKIGKRAIWQPDITLNNVRVPAENKLAEANSFRDVSRVLTATRGGASWKRPDTPSPPTRPPSPTPGSGNSSGNPSPATSWCRTSWRTCSPRSPPSSCCVSGWRSCRSRASSPGRWPRWRRCTPRRRPAESAWKPGTSWAATVYCWSITSPGT